MEFASHLGKKLLLPGLLDVVLYKLDMQDVQNLPKGEAVLQSSCFIKKPAIHSAGHRRRQLMDFTITRQNRSSDFLLYGKV